MILKYIQVSNKCEASGRPAHALLGIFCFDSSLGIKHKYGLYNNKSNSVLRIYEEAERLNLDLLLEHISQISTVIFNTFT